MKKNILLMFTVLVLLVGCATKSPDITPVVNFDADKYLGRWYEIARIDNFFEKDMSYVYADYHLNKNGSISVINSGLAPGSDVRKYINGVAKFVKNRATAYLEISFVRPFYTDYIVFRLEDNYQYSYVGGGDKDHLWLLSRTPQVSKEIKGDFIARANALGYDIGKVIWVKQ